MTIQHLVDWTLGFPQKTKIIFQKCRFFHVFLININQDQSLIKELIGISKDL